MANADVHARGLQSRSLIEIRDQLRNGINISHILKVTVSNEPENKTEASTIRKEIKNRIWNIPHMYAVPHNQAELMVSITWTMTDVGSMSAYYFGVNLPYIDEVIGNHTRIMLSTVCNVIRKVHPEFGNQWGLAYIVTKPLALLQAIPPADLDNHVAVQSLSQVVDDADEKEEDE